MALTPLPSGPEPLPPPPPRDAERGWIDDINMRQRDFPARATAADDQQRDGPWPPRPIFHQVTYVNGKRCPGAPQSIPAPARPPTGAPRPPRGPVAFYLALPSGATLLINMMSHFPLDSLIEILYQDKWIDRLDLLFTHRNSHVFVDSFEEIGILSGETVGLSPLRVEGPTSPAAAVLIRRRTTATLSRTSHEGWHASVSPSSLTHVGGGSEAHAVVAQVDEPGSCMQLVENL